MPGYLTTSLIVLYILTLSHSVIEAIDHIPVREELKNVNLNLHKLPIFPKNTIKFVVTPSPPTNKPKEKIIPKMSLLPQMTIKPTMKTFPTTEGRRKPIMKLRKFTINSYTNGKFDSIKKDPEINPHVTYTTLIDTAKKSNPEQGQEYITTKADLPKQIQNSDKSLPSFRNTNGKAQPNKKDKRKSEPNKNDFLFEEEQDRNEFIFLEYENQGEIADMLDNISRESNVALETSTEFKMMEKVRIKRSKNVIEEENMASTVSVLRYTGRDTRLNNNFYFKNINS